MLSTAKLIMIVKRQLTREITEDKLLHYMSEWCNTAKKQEASCCYEDCAIKYDDELLPAFQVPRADLENCYLRVPHCIKGAVPQHIVERLHKFYAQTFWCNVEVFKCCQAAQALAKRGLNVTRLFIGLSTGGVGQSLYSSHLQALYGHNFAYFDPNIWYHEEEMRKQVEQLNGCIILTGQETPATNRKLREDLFKKFASADGIAGRKPYGFCTKMIYTRGWKRLEANRMFRFSDVGKRDFNAILRRGFVWRFLARFEDPQVIESAYADIAKDGVFPKDPDLGDFLRSSAAVAAGLQLQHAFEAEHTKKECEEMIEQYAAMGGDGGLTEATMREACGLPPKDYRLAATRTAGVIILDAEQEDKSDDNWSAFRQGLLSFMLSRKMVTATPFALKPMKLQDGPNVTKDALLDGLTARKHCLKGPGKGKAEFAYIPLLTTGKSLGSIIDHTSRACELELPEAYAIEAFVEYVTACMHRREDAMILASVLKSAGSRRGRGRLAEQDKKLKETMLTKARKLEAAEEHAKQLLDRFPGQDRAAKRRRVVKSPDIKLEQGGRLRLVLASTPLYVPTTTPAQTLSGQGSKQRARALKASAGERRRCCSVELMIWTFRTQFSLCFLSSWKSFACSPLYRRRSPRSCKRAGRRVTACAKACSRCLRRRARKRSQPFSMEAEQHRPCKVSSSCRSCNVHQCTTSG